MFPLTCPEKSAFRAAENQGPKDLIPAFHRAGVDFIPIMPEKTAVGDVMTNAGEKAAFVYLCLHLSTFDRIFRPSRTENRHKAAFLPTETRIKHVYTPVTAKKRGFREITIAWNKQGT
jgi:hypothetical protein